jgi:hypothetical protein
MALTRMPSGSSSRASALTRPTIAHRVDATGGAKGAAKQADARSDRDQAGLVPDCFSIGTARRAKW